jgi:hypothetical protein
MFGNDHLNNWDAYGTVRCRVRARLLSQRISHCASEQIERFPVVSAQQYTDFPSIFLERLPQLSSRNLPGRILSGSISLSETLQHPHIVGDVQLVNGKLFASSGLV